MKVYGPLERAQIENVGALPTAGIKGRVVFYTVDSRFYYDDGIAYHKIVGIDTTDTLTNKTLSGNTAVNLVSGSGTLTLNTSGTATVPNATDTLVGKATTDTLTNKTFVADGTGNSLTNVADANIKAAAAIAITKVAPGTANQIIGANNAATANEYKTISGTASQVTVTHSANTITLAAPQNIATGSSPTFAGMTVTGASGVVTASSGVLGSTLGSANQILGTNNAATAPEQKTISGTANRVTVTHGAGTITLNGPQDLATSSNPQFASVKTTTSLILEDPGAGTHTTTIQAATLGVDYTLTLPTTAGSASQLIQTDGAGVLSFVSPASASAVSRNYIQNPEFRFWQRQNPTSSTSRANAAFGPDRWKVWTSGTNVNCLKNIDNDNTFTTYTTGKFSQADAVAKQFGVSQALETANCIDLRGKVATFSFVARSPAANITTIRAGIVEWTGTADTLGTLVSSWSTNPTLGANFAFKNTPADLTINATYARFDITVTLGTTFNNLLFFIWTPSTEAQNDEFDLKECMCVNTSEAINFSKVAKSYSEDLRECQRFFAKSFDVDTVPGATTTGAIAFRANGTSDIRDLRWPVTMRATNPSVTLYNPSTGGTGTWRDQSGAADRVVAISSTTENGQAGSKINITASVDQAGMQGHFIVDSEL